jgi:hypothetical protein
MQAVGVIVREEDVLPDARIRLVRPRSDTESIPRPGKDALARQVRPSRLVVVDRLSIVTGEDDILDEGVAGVDGCWSHRSSDWVQPARVKGFGNDACLGVRADEGAQSELGAPFAAVLPTVFPARAAG